MFVAPSPSRPTMSTLPLLPTLLTTRLWPSSLTSPSRSGTTPSGLSVQLPMTCNLPSTSSPQPTSPTILTSSARRLQNLSGMPSRSLSSLLAISNLTQQRGSPPPPLSSLSPPMMSRSSVPPSGSTLSPGE